MANPQLEDGYTRISNSLYEALYRTDLTGTEFRVVAFVIRQTFGYGRKSKELSATYIATGTGVPIRSVKRALSHLQELKIVVRVNSDSKGVVSELALNKNFESWNCWSEATGVRIDTSVQTDTSATDGTSDKNGTGVVPEMAPDQCQNWHPIKETFKETSKENIYEHFFEKAWQAYPKKKGKSAVSKKAKKELYEAGEETVMGAIRAYKREIESNETAEQFVLYGSTFFNGRWRDYVQQQEKKIVPAQEDEEPPIDLWSCIDAPIIDFSEEVGQ